MNVTIQFLLLMKHAADLLYYLSAHKDGFHRWHMCRQLSVIGKDSDQGQISGLMGLQNSPDPGRPCANATLDRLIDRQGKKQQ